MEKVEKIVIAGAVISQGFWANQVKQVIIDGQKLQLNPFNATKVQEYFINAVTGAGQVDAKERENHIIKQLKVNKHNKVVNALSASISGLAKNKEKSDNEICQ